MQPDDNRDGSPVEKERSGQTADVHRDHPDEHNPVNVLPEWGDRLKPSRTSCRSAAAAGLHRWQRNLQFESDDAGFSECEGGAGVQRRGTHGRLSVGIRGESVEEKKSQVAEHAFCSNAATEKLASARTTDAGPLLHRGRGRDRSTTASLTGSSSNQSSRPAITGHQHTDPAAAASPSAFSTALLAASQRRQQRGGRDCDHNRQSLEGCSVTVTSNFRQTSVIEDGSSYRTATGSSR